MEHILPENRLIEYVKPYLKAKGFKKKNKRWTKETPDFTISFLIQGSFFSKENYYIRPGIFINALMPAEEYYGHWMLDIKPTTPEEIMMILFFITNNTNYLTIYNMYAILIIAKSIQYL